MRLNLYRAEHGGHILKVWHDIAMCWYKQIDSESAWVLTARTRADARSAAHESLHRQFDSAPCTSPLPWILDSSTRTEVLGECDECLSPNMVTQPPADPDGAYLRTCPECGYKVSVPAGMLEKMAR